MAFNSYTSFAVWASKVVRGTKSVAGVLKFPGVSSVRTRRLELETDIDQGDSAYPDPRLPEYPTAIRLYTRFLATSAILSRKGRASALPLPELGRLNEVTPRGC
jgi:hypothetical protein